MGYSYQRTIHLNDTDAAGVVYFANLLHICHEAYEHCLTDLGFDWQNLLERGEIALPIVHADIDFFRPIRWGDRLLIKLFPVVNPKKPNKFTVQYQLLKAGSDKLVAQATTKHTSISATDRKLAQLPKILEKWLQNAPKYPDQKS
ncbi:1,4-dihydroxy-2-naphthoyl-CoA hydrolase [[Leptolyngbya] sp. PCC 7376]|uniref:acyl-CoA thioesterase n=1 Tax=[Leptolyngbya] sp. PCC 7376 TaxID=111781 RepID=UPI00029F033E|nr:thioesterase family protein [[Leptolyngbya] sp. PCC 7376]AFY39601.1 1,4-dihydroxy-2-naphthoyl-CoA hydrolase [[Leptolyngbya] sp. PCC 7376]